MKAALLLILLSLNMSSSKKLVVMSADGYLTPISRSKLKEYNPDIDYSKIYYADDFSQTFYGITGVYAEKEPTLSEASLRDLEYIKEKQELAGHLHLWASIASFIPFMINTPDHETLLDMVYSTDWDDVANLIARDVPLLVRGVMIKELNYILYKANTENRPSSDINFWRSFLNTYVKAKTIASRRIYQGSAKNPELGFTINIKLSLNQKKDGNFRGQLHLNVEGKSNTFDVKNIELDHNGGIIRFEHKQYGRKNYFEGDISSDGKTITDFGSYFNDRLLWEARELKLR